MSTYTINHAMFTTKNRFIYLSLAIALLAIEVFIALKVPSTSFIRHSLGDFLVVILMYFSIKSIFNINVKTLAIAICLFAFALEFTQYFHVLDLLEIKNRFIRVILGTSFSFEDLLMYALGSVTAYLADIFFDKKTKVAAPKLHSSLTPDKRSNFQ